MLDRAGRGARDNRRDRRCPVRGNDEPVRARSFGTAADGAEVVGIGHLVETDEQRALRSGRELPRIGVLVRLAPRQDSLMVARSRRIRQLAFELDLDARPLDVAQPRLRLLGALRRPQLEHLTTSAQRLAHRAAAVHLIARHFGTS